MTWFISAFSICCGFFIYFFLCIRITRIKSCRSIPHSMWCITHAICNSCIKTPTMCSIDHRRGRFLPICHTASRSWSGPQRNTVAFDALPGRRQRHIRMVGLGSFHFPNQRPCGRVPSPC